VVGGGIVGLATARRAILRAHPAAVRCGGAREGRTAGRIATRAARNSGVIHGRRVLPARAPKRPGCAPPAALSMVQYCEEQGSGTRSPARWFVASDETRPGSASRSSSAGARPTGVGTELIGPERLPRARNRTFAGRRPRSTSATTGIVDYAERLPIAGPRDRGWPAPRIAPRDRGAERPARSSAGIVLEDLRRTDRRSTGRHPAPASMAVRGVARARERRRPRSTASASSRFRGEYRELVPSRSDLVRHARLPGSRTRPIRSSASTSHAGSTATVHVGPNAVLAFAPRGVPVAQGRPAGHLGATFRFRGFLAASPGNNWRFGLPRDGALAEAGARFAPPPRKRLRPRRSTGGTSHRPPAGGAGPGHRPATASSLDDFVIRSAGRAVHVFETRRRPAATASLEIGATIAPATRSRRLIVRRRAPSSRRASTASDRSQAAAVRRRASSATTGSLGPSGPSHAREAGTDAVGHARSETGISAPTLERRSGG